MSKIRPTLFRRLVPILIVYLLIGFVPADGAPGDAPAMNPSSPFGLNTHLGTRYPVPGSLDLPAARVTELGAAWAREDFAWPRIQPERGSWDFRVQDEMVAAQSQRRVSILGRLGYSVGWATPDLSDAAGEQSFAMPTRVDWERYIRTTVTRYRDRVHYWEVWNEPDNVVFWKGRPDPRTYAALLRSAYTTIKDADPTATVLIGGVSGFDMSYLLGVAQAGGWDYFDILALHLYTDPASPEDGQMVAMGLGAARTLAHRYGAKPIWITEFGWESGMSPRNRYGAVDERDQANFLVRSYMALLAQPEIQKAFWYNLHDDWDANFGLLRFGTGYTDYSGVKPAFRAYATMTRELAGAYFKEVVDLSAGKRVVDSWEQPGGWVQAGPDNGLLQSDMMLPRSGKYAGRFDYRFPTTGNDYVAYRPATPLDIGHPSVVGLWVNGNRSGHLIQIQLQDQGGEILQFPLGKIEGDGWKWMQVPIRGVAEPGNRLGGGNRNGRLDGNVRVHALVIDDQPDEARVQGSIWIDDLTVINGPETYDYRWQRGDEIIDVVWAPAGAQVQIPTASQTATVVDIDGSRTTIVAKNGALSLWVDARPRYIHHVPLAAGPHLATQAPPASSSGTTGD